VGLGHIMEEGFTAYQVVHVHAHVSGPENMRRGRQDTDYCIARKREKAFNRKNKGSQVGSIWHLDEHYSTVINNRRFRMSHLQ